MGVIFFSHKFGGEAVNEVVIITIHQHEVGSCQADHQKGTKGRFLPCLFHIHLFNYPFISKVTLEK